MIRSALVGGGIFLLAALFWAVHDPVCAFFEVASLSSPGHDPRVVESSLLERRRGAVWALHKAQGSWNAATRLRSARLLALLGDDYYDGVLLEALAQENDADTSALAERLLLSVWDRRNGPADNEMAARMREAEYTHGEIPVAERELDIQLQLHPLWAGGYVARARLQLRNANLGAARADALNALRFEPYDFEAIVLLGRCYLYLDEPESALECFEEALALNPRLKHELSEELKTAREESNAARERRQIERYRSLPAG